MLFASCLCFHHFVLSSFVSAPRTLDLGSFQDEMWPLIELHAGPAFFLCRPLLCEGSCGPGMQMGTSAGMGRDGSSLGRGLTLDALTH